MLLFAERRIDYVRFTIKDYTLLKTILETFGCIFEEMPGGRYLYRRGVQALGGGLQVFYDGVTGDQQGVCVQISGEACRMIEMDHSFDSWRDFLEYWRKKGAQFTRIDIAIDDRDGKIKFETVENAIRGRDYTSRAKGYKYHQTVGGSKPGRTIEIGSRQSLAMMRCYERGIRVGDPIPWLRFEFEFKGAKAHQVALTLINEGWNAAAGCCRSVIDFVDPFSECATVSRREVCPWWLALIEASKHVVSVTRTVVDTVRRRFEHLSKQWAPTLWAFDELQGGDLEWLRTLVENGRRRVNEKVRRLVSAGSKQVYSPNFAQAVPLPS